MRGEGADVDATLGKERHCQESGQGAYGSGENGQQPDLGHEEQGGVAGQNAHGLHDSVFAKIFQGKDEESAGDAYGNDGKDQGNDNGHADGVQIDQLLQVRHEFGPGSDGGQGQHLSVLSHDRFKQSVGLQEDGDREVGGTFR